MKFSANISSFATYTTIISTLSSPKLNSIPTSYRRCKDLFIACIIIIWLIINSVESSRSRYSAKIIYICPCSIRSGISENISVISPTSGKTCRSDLVYIIRDSCTCLTDHSPFCVCYATSQNTTICVKCDIRLPHCIQSQNGHTGIGSDSIKSCKTVILNTWSVVCCIPSCKSVAVCMGVFSFLDILNYTFLMWESCYIYWVFLARNIVCKLFDFRRLIDAGNSIYDFLSSNLYASKNTNQKPP